MTDISTEMTDAEHIAVNVGSGACVDVGAQLLYIKSGQKEIADYVDGTAKPNIDNYVKTNSYPKINSYVDGTAKPNIDNYVTKNVKPYADSAKASADKAKTSETNAKSSENKANVSETNAKASENAAAASARVASTAAVAASTAQTEAQKWAVGSLSEQPAGSAKHWAEEAQNITQLNNASEQNKGLIRLASNAETKAGTDVPAAVTPKKLKDNYVSKFGDTMTGQLAVKDANIILSSTKDVVNAFIKTDEDDTQTPTKNHIDAFRVVDKNNKIMSDFRSQRNSTSNLTQMIARKNKSDGTIKEANITCSVDANGNPSSVLNQTTYVNGTMVSNLDNVNFIARSKSLVKGTTPADSNKYVGYDWQDKNGQRLAYLGVKYGTDGVKRLELQKIDSNLSEFNISYHVRTLYDFFLQNTQHTLGNVDVNTWLNNQIQFQDSKGTRLARVQPLLVTDGTSRLYLAASKGLESESSLVIGSDGYTQCPKPADTSNSNAIATTNWAGGLNRPNIWLSSNTFKGGGIEFSPANNPNHGGYIDFHYNGSTSDYTSRIIEVSEHVLEFTGSVQVKGFAKFFGNVIFSDSGSIAFNNTGPITISKNVDRVDNYATTNHYTQPNVRVDGNARYKSVCTGYTKGTAPTTSQFGGVSTCDKNNVEVATLYSSIDTNNNVTSALWVKQPTAAGTEAKAISIWCDKNGSFHSYCGIQSQDNNSILTIVAHGNNWIKYSDGRLEQWGTCTTAAQTITLYQPYKDTNYMITVTLGTNENHNYCSTIKDITTTGFNKNDRGQYWHTIGWWK